MRARTGLMVAAFVVLAGSGHTQPLTPWSFGLAVTRDLGLAITATTFAEPSASDPGPYALTLTCSPTGRRVSLSSARTLPWETSVRDPRESFVRLLIWADSAPPTGVALLRETDGTGQVVTRLRVLKGEIESPDFDELVRRTSHWFDPALASAARVTVDGLAPGHLVFRFDTLTRDQRERLRKACFEIDAARAAETRCKGEARGRVRHEFEDALFDAKRAWCETTRDTRRGQLLGAFVRGVTAARNGGARLASAFEAFITANPDVIAADGRGSTQSCPETHFTIDVARLRPVLERQAPGGTLSAEAAERHLAELLKESGIVVSTVQLKFEPPPPDIDTRALSAAIAKAEAECVVRERDR